MRWEQTCVDGSALPPLFWGVFSAPSCQAFIKLQLCARLCAGSDTTNGTDKGSVLGDLPPMGKDEGGVTDT